MKRPTGVTPLILLLLALGSVRGYPGNEVPAFQAAQKSEHLDSLIQDAARSGDLDRLAAALASSRDLNGLDGRGETPLIAGVQSGSIQIVEILLNHGASVRGRGSDGRTALHHAAMIGNVPLMKLLVQHGAFVDDVAQHALVQGKVAEVTPLIDAVSQDQLEAVAWLLDAHSDLGAHGQGIKSLNLLAKRLGTRPTLLAGSKPRTTTLQGLLALQFRVFNLLLAAGADVRSPQCYALVYAAEKGQCDLVEALLGKGADPNSPGPTPQLETPLIAAISALSRQAAEKFATTGDLVGSVPEAKTIEEQPLQLIQELLQRKADPDKPDGMGRTPLMRAVIAELPQAIELLVGAGAKLEGRDARGRTALQLAAEQNCPEAARVLLAHGSDVDAVDHLGRSALMLTIDDGANDTARALWKPTDAAGTQPTKLPNPDGHPAIVRLLLRYNANPLLVAKDGSTARSLAQKNHFTGILSVLP